jgi:hypothetical protein
VVEGCNGGGGGAGGTHGEGGEVDNFHWLLQN